MIRRTVLLTAVGLLLGGCSSMQQGSAIAPSVCTPGVCKVVVTITDCFAWDGIKTDPEPIVIGQSQLIQWRIHDSNSEYTFASDGITINWNPGQEFDDPKLLAAGKMFSWHDKYTIKDKFKYTVNVRNRNGVRCRPYDPVIHNQ